MLYYFSWLLIKEYKKKNLMFLIILMIVIAYVFALYKIESMADVSTQLTQDQVKNLIKEVYFADVEAIRNLSNVATKLQAGSLTIPSNLTIGGELNIIDANTKLLRGINNSLRIKTPNGYVDIGAQNDNWAHIYTDRPKFAFNKQLTDVSADPYNDYLKNGNVKISGNFETGGNINGGNINGGNINTNKITIDGIPINKVNNKLKISGVVNPDEIWMDKCKKINFQNTWETGYVSLLAGCNGGQGINGNWLSSPAYRNDGSHWTGPWFNWQ